MQSRFITRGISLARIAAAAALALCAPSLGLAQSAMAPKDTPALRGALQHDLDAYLKARGAAEHVSGRSRFP